MHLTSESSLEGEHCDERHDQVIHGLHESDLLDKRIGIWPRNKSSDEIQLLLSKGFRTLAIAREGPFLPDAMKRIINQFMVANKYVGSGRHLHNKKGLQRSLMVRLDLHIPENESEKKKFADCKADIFTYVMAQTKRWEESGIIISWSGNASPMFHPCVEGWTRYDWDGVILENVSHTHIVPFLAEDTLSALAGRVWLAHERIPAANKAGGSQTMATTTTAPVPNTRSSSKSASAAYSRSSSSLLSKSPSSIFSVVSASLPATKNSKAFREPWSQTTYKLPGGKPEATKGIPDTLRGHADSYLSFSYDIDDDRDKVEDRLGGYHYKQDYRRLNRDRPLYEPSPAVTAPSRRYNQHSRLQTTEPSYTKLVEYHPYGRSSQGMIQGVDLSRHAQRAQTAAPSYLP